MHGYIIGVHYIRSCNVDTSDLPDIYTQSSRVYISGTYDIAKLAIEINMLRKQAIEKERQLYQPQENYTAEQITKLKQPDESNQKVSIAI